MKLQINHIFVLILIFLLLVLTVLLALAIYFLQSKNSEEMYSSSDFYSTRYTIPMNQVTFILLGTFRNKLTIRLIGIVALFFSLSYIDTKDFVIAMTTLVFVYPVIAFSAIRYYSTTVSYRKMNPFFGLTPFRETIITTFVNWLINLPLIITAIGLQGDYEKTAYYGFIIFEAALIMGIIFPKNKSSVNEFSASVLCVIIAVSLYLISKSFLIFISILLVLTLIKYSLIKRSFLDEAI
ncbi:hypothetical protein [Bacillus sp. FJAT-47783]|uniref:hypothetical protein n=1 Tax=Bacillus sp. FJAT-47783 TaxID=2922712 RepID=UPI001FABDD8D|nr:hypothetical protein [Bacillus sp. FJAT-47783]